MPAAVAFSLVIHNIINNSSNSINNSNHNNNQDNLRDDDSDGEEQRCLKSFAFLFSGHASQVWNANISSCGEHGTQSSGS